MSPSAHAARSLAEIRREGWDALTQRLGVAGAMRFMMQYDPGHGDYTEERQQILADLSLDDALSTIRNTGSTPTLRDRRLTSSTRSRKRSEVHDCGIAVFL